MPGVRSPVPPPAEKRKEKELVRAHETREQKSFRLDINPSTHPKPLLGAGLAQPQPAVLAQASGSPWPLCQAFHLSREQPLTEQYSQTHNEENKQARPDWVSCLWIKRHPFLTPHKSNSRFFSLGVSPSFHKKNMTEQLTSVLYRMLRRKAEHQ